MPDISSEKNTIELQPLNFNKNKKKYINIFDIDLALETDQEIEITGLAKEKLAETKKIAHALKKNQNIIALNLSNNELGAGQAETAHYFADMVHHHHSIASLILNDNKLGKNNALGAQYFATAIEHNAFLVLLSLTDNHLGEDDALGMHYIAQALQKNTSLLGVVLENNQLGENDAKGLQYLARALQKHPSIFFLQLENNQLSDDQVNHLLNTLNENYCITSLTVDQDNLSSDTQLKLSTYLERNCQLRDQLHQAIYKNNINTVSTLLTKGVGLTSTSDPLEGNCALHWAVRSGSKEMLAFILDKMTHQHLSFYYLENKQGITPYEMALKEFPELASIFPEHAKTFCGTTVPVPPWVSTQSILTEEEQLELKQLLEQPSSQWLENLKTEQEKLAQELDDIGQQLTEHQHKFLQLLEQLRKIDDDLDAQKDIERQLLETKNEITSLRTKYHDINQFLSHKTDVYQLQLFAEKTFDENLHPELHDYYRFILIGLSNLFSGVHDIASGLVENHASNTATKGAKGAKYFGKVAGMAPFIGNTIKGLFSGSGNAVQFIADKRQENLIKNIACKFTKYEAEYIATWVAIKLTQRYQLQIAEIKPQVDESILNRSKDSLLKSTLNKKPLKPVRRVASYALEQITSSLFDETLVDENATKLTVDDCMHVVVHTPTKFEKATDDVKEFLQQNLIKTKDNKSWYIPHIYLKPGIQTADPIPKYFSSKERDVFNYGFCIGTEQEALERGWKDSKSISNLATNAPLIVKTLESSEQSNAPQQHRAENNNNNNATALLEEQSNHLSQKYDIALRRIQALEQFANQQQETIDQFKALHLSLLNRLDVTEDNLLRTSSIQSLNNKKLLTHIHQMESRFSKIEEIISYLDDSKKSETHTTPRSQVKKSYPLFSIFKTKKTESSSRYSTENCNNNSSFEKK